MKKDYDIVHVPPDKGCKYYESCVNCIYPQCVEEGGVKGLASTIRRGLIVSYAKQGFHFTILANIFHTTDRRIQQIIAERAE